MLALIAAARIVASIILWDTTAGDVKVSHPTAVVTGEQGSYRIASVPDGAK